MLDDLAAAQEMAEAHNPDYDAKVDACRLAHNQHSPRRAIVAKRVASIFEDEISEYESQGCIIVCTDDGDELIALRDVEAAE